MLKELGKPKTKKRNRPDSRIDTTNSKIDLSDLSSIFSEDEESNSV